MLKQDDLRKGKTKPQTIFILVANHNGAYVPELPYIHPIQVGAANTEKRFSNMLQDDIGDHISARNSSYCELTAVYWAWKNVQADYIGLFHYRRFLSFDQHRKTEKDGFIHMTELNQAAINTLHLTPQNMQNYIVKHDIVMMRPINVFDMTAGNCLTVRQQFDIVPQHRPQDLTKAVEILSVMYPDYIQDAKRYLDGEKAFYCNMFIMKQELFHTYCQWLFPILDQLYIYQRNNYTEQMGTYEERLVGFIAERLQGIFITHLKRTQRSIRIGHLPPVLFTEKTTVNQQNRIPWYKMEVRRQRMRTKNTKDS